MSDIARQPIAEQADTEQHEVKFRQLVQSWLTCPLMIVSDGASCENTPARWGERKARAGLRHEICGNQGGEDRAMQASSLGIRLWQIATIR
jgi:hypothetical protein